MVGWTDHTSAGRETECKCCVDHWAMYHWDTLQCCTVIPCRHDALSTLTCLEIKHEYFLCPLLAVLEAPSVGYEHVVEVHHTGEGHLLWNMGVRFRHDFPALQRGEVDHEELVEIDKLGTSPSFASEGVSVLVDLSDGHALQAIREFAAELS